MPVFQKPSQQWCEHLATSQPGFRRVLEPVNATAPLPTLAQVSVPDEMAQPWVVTLGPLQQGNVGVPPTGVLTPQIPTDSFAIVEWGRGGVQTWAVVDWPPHGARFQVDGAFVRVSGGIRGLAAAAAGVAALTNVAAFIAPGRTESFAQRTIRYTDGLTNGSEDRAVPPYAIDARLSFRQSSAPATAALVFIEGVASFGAGATLWSFRADGLTSNVAAGRVAVTLAGGTNFVRFRVGAAVANDPRIVYRLGL